MSDLQAPPSLTNIVVWYGPDTTGTEPINNQFELILQTIVDKGCDLTTTRQFDQTIAAMTEQAPDLLLIHLQTSGEQGYRLCQALRQQAIAPHLPIVFVGTRGTSHEWVKALGCGGNDYLQLPITAEECWLRLERHLVSARMVRRLQADQISLTQKLGEYTRVLAQQEALKASLAKENQALQQLAFIDGLTQVANRRSFNQNIVKRWEEARKKRQRISLLLCDIDYFKRYNDTYGHLAGDACLQAVAVAMQQGAHRHHDQVARYGGEEFAILLPNTDAEGAQKVAIAVQEEIARAQIPHQGSLIKPFLSISIGISTLRPTQSEYCNYEALIKGADDALYNAKLQGRDRTVLNTAQHKQLAAEKTAKTGQKSTSFKESPLRKKVLLRSRR